MPIKITWKSALAALAAVAGFLSATNVASMHLPKFVAGIMIAVGLGATAVERIADAIDYRTDGGVNVGKLRSDLGIAQTTALSASQEIAVIRANADKAIASARAAVLADLAAATAKPTADPTPAPVASPAAPVGPPPDATVPVAPLS